jgi:hypothetical protein
MKVFVFVNSIKSSSGINVVEASNGKEEGPPFIRFEIPSTDIEFCHIGKKYLVDIEETEE